MACVEEGFTRFARLNSERLRHAAFLLTGDRDEAEDLAQTALVRTYSAWPRVQLRGAHNYARTTLVNLITDRWRRPLREYPTGEVPERSTWTNPADEATDRHWLVEMLRSLPPQELAVVVLRHYFDLSESETAAELKVTVGTIKSTNARALGKLRAIARGSNGNPTGPEG
jgi:RNA polymerase sigma-70 factor (sigma-E family)